LGVVSIAAFGVSTILVSPYWGWENELKQRGYSVRVERDCVSVEHRASFRPTTIAILVVAYLVYCLFPAVRRILTDFFASWDPITGCFALFMLLIPFFAGATWLYFASGEVMYCDAHELRFARRRTLGRWHRFRFSSTRIKGVQMAYRGGPRRRSFSVLTFQYEGRVFDMLEEIKKPDSDRVLRACKSMGLDVVIPVDPAAAMLEDIDRRGWFINPLRPDRDENAQLGQ
jgi:hypothetical protein